MGKALVAFMSAPLGPQGNNTYMPLAQAAGTLDAPNVEAGQRITVRVAGTLSLLAVNANATGTARTVRLRKNTADGNQVVTPTDTTAGIYVDSTHTDSLSAGDNFNLKFTSSGSPTYNWGRCAFTATTNHAAFYAGSRNGSTRSTGSTTYYPGTGSNTSITTEANTKLRMRAGGTAQYLQIYVASNTLSGTTATLVSRLNGADGALTTTITNGATGLYEDTTHSDTIAAGDDYTTKLAITGGSGGIVPGTVGYTIVNSSSTTNDIFAGVDSSGGITRSASASNTYYPVIGSIGQASTTEANQTIQHGFAATVTRLRCLVTANTYSASGTLKSRLNGADGSLSATITAGVTGVYEDTTNSENVGATDNYCAAIVGGTSGSITLFWIGATEQEQASGSVFASAGSGMFAATGLGTTNGVIAASGTGAMTAAGRGAATAVLAASGLGAMADVGAATFNGVLSSGGAGSMAASGASAFAGVLSASGVAAMAAASAASAASVLSAPGVGAMAPVGASAATATAAMAGAGVFQAVGRSTFSAVYAASGAGSLSLVGEATFSGVMSASGVGNMAEIGTTVAASVVAMSGASAFSGVGLSSFMGVLAAAGAGDLTVAAVSVNEAVFSSSGSGVFSAISTVLYEGVFQAVGHGVFQARTTLGPTFAMLSYIGSRPVATRGEMSEEPIATAGAISGSFAMLTFMTRGPAPTEGEISDDPVANRGDLNP